MPTFSGSIPVSTSSLVTTSPVSPLTRVAYLSATRSSQPVRRARPVVVPNSPPASRIWSPSASSSSVGNGPAPTRVVYALAMPQTSSSAPGPVPVGPVFLGHRVKVELRQLGVGPEHEPLRLHGGVDLLPQDLLVQEVLHADAEPSRLVGIAGADAAPRRADLKLPELRLALLVQKLVVGHDQMRVRGDAQPAKVDPPSPQLVDLGREDDGV